MPQDHDKKHQNHQSGSQRVAGLAWVVTDIKIDIKIQIFLPAAFRGIEF